MGVYKRKDGQDGYLADIFANHKRVARRAFKARREAEAWFKAQSADLLRGELRIHDKRTPPLLFGDLANLFLDQAKAHLAHATYIGYRGRVAASLMPAFGGLRAVAVTRADVLAWRTERLQATAHPSQVNHDMDILRAVLFFGVERGYLPANPAARIRHQHEPKIVERRFYSPAEMEAMLSKLDPATEDHGLVLAAFSTGLRPRELAAFRFEWIDWSREAIDVPNTRLFSPKSHKPRTIPLLVRLREWLAAQGRTEGPVFRSCQPGRRGGPVKSFTKRVLRIRRLTRTEFDLYDARHTYASQLLAAGAPLPEVQAVMGHSDIKTTMGYSHLAPSYLANVRQIAGAAFGEAPVRPLRVVNASDCTPVAPLASDKRTPRKR
ncbi:MAG: site-specific integrase [Candidatus Wallbacteria bacterium]|nr:site-specific integrase [Candidatus Wallbacteria bacterium]